MHRILWLIAGAIVLADAIWAAAVHFDLDKRGYLFVAEVATAVGALGFFYGRFRRDDRLSAMLSGTAFLIVFSAAFSVLNYMLLTVAGPRIDGLLAALDRTFGFDWVAAMTLMAYHPVFNFILQCCYISVLPQIAILVLALGWVGRDGDVFRFCLSVAIAALVTVAFWTFFPSFGAFSFYHLAPAVASHLNLALDGKYADELVHLLAFGPGQISPQSARGLVGFPSYHAALAAMVAWYASKVTRLKWPAIVLNIGALVATPIQGGHHLADVLAGIAVAAAAIATSARIATALRGFAPEVESSRDRPSWARQFQTEGKLAPYGLIAIVRAPKNAPAHEHPRIPSQGHSARVSACRSPAGSLLSA